MSSLYSALEKSIHAREQDKAIVLVTGVFDGLHSEHVVFLQKASQQGDVLFVGIESDVRVRQIKGVGRPLYSEIDRQKALAQLPEVDEVFVLPEQFFSEQEHLDLLKKIRPSVLAVSSHTCHQRQKEKLMKKVGGELRVVHKHNPKVSTTQLLAVS